MEEYRSISEGFFLARLKTLSSMDSQVKYSKPTSGGVIPRDIEEH